ncbi:MAG: polymer-forming cytoskeletal protein [Chitinophagaceae bacterium]|nr:MAG: polymer-forming cytoskeletal protein [Chitinophagaceae bacterium]
MFTRKEDEPEMNTYMPSNSSPSNYTPAAVSSPASTGRETNLISKGTTINGDLQCESDVRIDGEVKGTIHSSSKVVIGSEGYVEGDVECIHAEVLGHVKGSLKVQDHLYLRGNARMDGDVLATHFEMEPSVKFNGKCTMQDKVELTSLPKREGKPTSGAASFVAKSAVTDKSTSGADKTNGEKENKITNGIFQKQAV